MSEPIRVKIDFDAGAMPQLYMPVAVRTPRGHSMARTVTPQLAGSPYISSDGTMRHAGAQQCMHFGRLKSFRERESKRSRLDGIKEPICDAFRGLPGQGLRPPKWIKCVLTALVRQPPAYKRPNLPALPRRRSLANGP
jgi:hypothetical protein